VLASEGNDETESTAAAATTTTAAAAADDDDEATDVRMGRRTCGSWLAKVHK